MTGRSELFNKFCSVSDHPKFTLEIVIPFFIAYYIKEYKGQQYFSESDLVAVIMTGSKGHLNPCLIEAIVETEWKRTYHNEDEVEKYLVQK